MAPSSDESRTRRQTLPGYILSGGRSRRFGTDKARAMLDGQPLIVRLAERMRGLALPGGGPPTVTVVADRPGRYADLGLATIADDEPGLGPLAGLRRALADAGTGWMLVGSCDLLELRDDWIVRLIEARQGDRPVACFRGDRWQPFPGLFHVALLGPLDAYLRQGGRSVQGLLGRVPAVAVDLPDDWPTIVQANTAADLARYRSGRGM